MHTGNRVLLKTRIVLTTLTMCFVVGIVGCSSVKKISESETVYGPMPQTEPETKPTPTVELPGPAPSPSPTVPVDEYGPAAQSKLDSGVNVIFGRYSKNPAALIGSIRQLEQEGVVIKKIIAIETSSVILGIHVASKTQSKADWDITQIYRELEKKEKLGLQKKINQIFPSSGMIRTQIDFQVVSQMKGNWILNDSGTLVERLTQAIQGCGWVDLPQDNCTDSPTKERYIELMNRLALGSATHPTVLIQKEVPTEKLESGVLFIQMPEALEGDLEPSSRSQHLLLGKKLIKRETETIKNWIKETKEKNGQS